MELLTDNHSKCITRAPDSLVFVHKYYLPQSKAAQLVQPIPSCEC